MPTLTDIQTTPLSSLNHIDALLGSGPDWNYLTPFGNVMYYTFSTMLGNEVRDGTLITGQQEFTLSQQQATRTAMNYLSSVTGIVFTEVANGNAAQVHFSNIDIEYDNTTGLLSWNAEYTFDRGSETLIDYDADAYVYLDNAEFRGINANLQPGTAGYQTLLHELGHMLGLKHPFEEGVYLPPDQDNTAHTLMSYTDNGGPYSQFSRYDIAALNWLYGGDGLGGNLGINSVTGARFITGTLAGERLTGTAFNDMLKGDGGNDTIVGGEGLDTALYAGTRADYEIVKGAGGYVVTAKNGLDGRDTLLTIETLKFSDASMSVAYDDVVQALYVAYFGRAADTGGLANFQSQLAALNAPRDFASVSAAYSTNASIRVLIDSFGNSAESAALYSGTTTAFVTAIYRNIFNREPDAEGLAFWVEAINGTGLSKANASLSIMAAALSNTSAQGMLDGALVTNKTTIASDFAFAIDTAAEFEGYKGEGAAAAVRSMLASVTAATDVAAFQATIKSVLDSLDGPGPANGSMAGLGYAVRVPDDIDAGIMLVGVPQTNEGVLLA